VGGSGSARLITSLILAPALCGWKRAVDDRNVLHGLSAVDLETALDGSTCCIRRVSPNDHAFKTARQTGLHGYASLASLYIY
jgi:hypothetical protein